MKKDKKKISTPHLRISRQRTTQSIIHTQDEPDKDESTMKFIALALALSKSVRGLDYPIGITNCGVFQQIDGKVSFAWVKFDNYIRLTQIFHTEAPKRAVTMNQVCCLVNAKVGVLND